MAITFQEAAQRLHAAGLRLTRPREILLHLILSSTGPFSVKMLYERALAAGAAVHLVTVHRNLSEFVEIGLVDELPGEDNRLYALHAEKENGAHVYCIDCRAVVPLPDTPFDLEARRALDQALSQRGFDAATVRLMLTAHCTAQQAQQCPRLGENAPPETG